jgi:N-acetylneuraminic acid mutarotase
VDPETARDAEIVMSVCNGAGFLAKAGLLDGKEVTTTAGGIDWLQAEVPTAKVVAGKRFVDSGKIVTCGGLSAGIDGALYVAQKALGKGWGQMIAVWLEYDWHPDAKCAWGLLADRWLPNPIVDWQDFKGVWTPTNYGGDTDHWENKARLETDLSAEEVRAKIARNVTRYYKWSPREKRTAAKTGESLWAFRDKRGRNWHGVVSVEPTRDQRGVFEVTIRIDLQVGTPHWSRAPSLRTDHAYHAAVAVDGKIYVFGGGADVEVLDPTRNAWVSLGKSPTDCDFPGAAALGKQIYVVGGLGVKNDLATVDVFDVVSRKWHSGVPLQVARSRLAAVAFGGKLYAIGGYIGHARNTGVVEMYDPAKRAWVKKASMPTPLHGHAAVVVNNRILVVGGYEFDSGRMGAWSGVEEYDPATDRWRSRSAMPGGGRGFLGAAVVGGKVFAIGGHHDQFRVERYDPETDRWSALGPPPDPFERGGTVTIGNEIYLIGGETNPRGVWRFRPLTD